MTSNAPEHSDEDTGKGAVEQDQPEQETNVLAQERSVTAIRIRC